MKKKIKFTLTIVLLLAIGYLFTLSDPPLDVSKKYVDIESYISKKEMIADIDTLQNTFERVHPNPYRFKSKFLFTSKLNSIKSELPDSLSTIKFWRVVDQIVCRYLDAHSELADRYIFSDYIKKDKLFFPFSVDIHNEKLFISKDKKNEQVLPEGTEIQKINGINSQQLIDELISHSGKEIRFLDILDISDTFWYYLWKAYDWDSDFKIHYYKKNNVDTLDSITVKGIVWKERKSSDLDASESLTFSFLKDTIGYMKITDFNSEKNEISKFYKSSFDKLKEKKSGYLILDFRGHSGGRDSYSEDLAKYISKHPFRKLSKAKWKITKEFKEAFDRKYVPKSIRWFKPIYLINEYSRVFYGAKIGEIIEVNYEFKKPLPKEKRFQGEVFLLTDHDTFSAGSIFAEMFKHFKMGKIIGGQTGNLYSFNGFALANFTLPNSNLSYKVSSVYNLANNGVESLKSVEPHHLVDSENSLNYVLENLIK